MTAADLIRVAAVALAYIAAGKIGLSLAFVNASASAVWAPTGIAIATILLFGRPAAIGVFVAAFIVNVTTAGSAATSLAIAAGNTLEGLIGAWLIRVACGGPAAFERIQDVFRFALVALAAPLVSATIGVTSLTLGGYAEPAAYPEIWLTWWLGDVSGALIVAPLIIIWSRRERASFEHGSWPEFLGLAAIAAVIGALLFLGVHPLSTAHAPIAFVTFPLLAFAAYRYGPLGASLFVAVFSGIAAWGTLQGYGPFARASQNESLLFLQSFMAVAALTSLTLAAANLQRRRADAALRHAEHERVRERDEFLSIAAHELRTPITSLQLAAQFALRKVATGATGSQIAKPLQTIDLQAAKLSRLVSQLLDNVRLDAGRLTIQRELVDLGDLVQDVAEEVRAMKERADIRVDATHTTATVDALRIEQVVRNLIDNAVKFSPNGGAIEVSVATTDDHVRIAIRDHGVGVAPEDRSALFQRYQHAHGKDRSGGLGLGLFVSREIVERHGGTIEAEHPTDGGTRMIVTLPRRSTSRDSDAMS
jgi:signal transduction histidine kinase